ncbi:MAG: nitroreductase/quinone reductase family protein [Candidatus Binatia bacterium]
MKMNPMAEAIVRGFSRIHTALFRRFGLTGPGVIGKHTLILTTRGRKTGREIPTPLLYVEDGGKLYIVASFGGNDVPPGWYRNLKVNPEVGVEMSGSRSGRYRARTLGSEEAAPIWPKLLAIYPAYSSYQKKTTRVIPIVELAAS